MGGGVYRDELVVLGLEGGALPTECVDVALLPVLSGGGTHGSQLAQQGGTVGLDLLQLVPLRNRCGDDVLWCETVRTSWSSLTSGWSTRGVSSMPGCGATTLLPPNSRTSCIAT